MDSDFAPSKAASQAAKIYKNAPKIGAGAASKAGKAGKGAAAAGATKGAGKAGSTSYYHRATASERLESVEHQVSSFGTEVAFFPMFMGPILLLAGRIVGKVPFLGKLVQTGTAGTLHSAYSAAEGTQLKDIANLPGNALHQFGDFTSEVYGEESGISTGAKKLATSFGENISQGHAATKTLTAKSRALLNEFGKASGEVKADSFAIKRATKLREKHMTKIAEEAKAIADSTTRNEAQMVDQAKGLFRSAKRFLGGSSSFKPDEKILQETPAELKAIANRAMDLHKAASGEAHAIDYGHMIGRLEDLQHEVHQFQKGNVMDKRVADQAGKLIGRMETIRGSADAAVFQHARVNGAKMGTLFEHSTRNLGQMSVASAGLKGAFGISSAAIAGKNVLSFGEHLHNLKEIMGGLTGKPTERVSTFEVLFSNKAPEIVQQARKGLMNHFAPQLAADAGSLLVNAHFMLRTGGPEAMMAGMGAQMLAGNFADNNTILDEYARLKEMEAQGVDVPTEEYANLIGHASQNAALHGGARNVMVKRMAEQYKTEGLGLGAILTEINEGKAFDDRALKIENTLKKEHEEGVKKAKLELEKKDSPTGKILSSHAAAVADKPKLELGANDNVAPSLKLDAQAVQHHGKLAEVNREVGGNA